MMRLHVVVEGQTEETFVRDVLAPHLSEKGVFCDARCVETGRRGNRVFKGGGATYGKVKNDLARWMREDDNDDVYFSTMIDLYQLPSDFPAVRDFERQVNLHDRVAELEQIFRNDLEHPRDHFIPYFQVHEFEALLFADVQKFASRFPRCDGEINDLERIGEGYEFPEHINNENPPSKRVCSVLPSYRKRTDGPTIARKIGLEAMRQQCDHFDRWVTLLERLS